MFFKSNQIEKQVQELLEYFKSFQITDLIGFGQILGVEEKEDFIEFCQEIAVAFTKENRIKRKQLLKFAKDIKIANECMVPASKENEDQAGGEDNGT